MAFDFPASPAEGQLFAPSGGPLYKFTNGVWTIPSTPPVMSISDTAPANPIPGQLWWRSSDGLSFVWFDDGTSKQWVGFNVSATPYSPAFIQQQIITASGAITLNVNTRAFQVEVQGGGGSGGSSGTTAASQAAGGGGGGGGGYCSKWIIRPAGAYSPTCTVGASALAGNNGNASSFTDGTNTLNANGGIVGVISGGTIMGGSTGGAGGGTSGGDVFRPGDAGGWGLAVFFSGYGMGRGGLGGSSRLGAGGQSPMTINNVAGGAAGVAGTGYGSGGSGGEAIFGGGPAQGGGGNPGVVIITEYR